MHEIETILSEVRRIWLSSAAEQLERGVWIAMHAALEESAADARTPVLGSWFMTDRVLKKTTLVSYKIFMDNLILTGSKVGPRMGGVQFAPYRDSDEYYLAVRFAPLHAEAFRIRIREGEVERIERLWTA